MGSFCSFTSLCQNSGRHIQASLKVFCACKHRSEKNVHAEKIDCSSHEQILKESICKNLKVWHFVPVSNAHHSCRLMSSGHMIWKYIYIFMRQIWYCMFMFHSVSCFRLSLQQFAIFQS